jgi:hypothetical protein
MTTFKNSVNAFGNSAGDDLSKNSTEWCGRGVLPKGKLKRYPSAVANISSGNRRLAKAKHGDGGGSGTTVRGQNAFTKGGKGK